MDVVLVPWAMITSSAVSFRSDSSRSTSRSHKDRVAYMILFLAREAGSPQLAATLQRGIPGAAANLTGPAAAAGPDRGGTILARVFDQSGFLARNHRPAPTRSFHPRHHARRQAAGGQLPAGVLARGPGQHRQQPLARRRTGRQAPAELRPMVFLVSSF